MHIYIYTYFYLIIYIYDYIYLIIHNMYIDICKLLYKSYVHTIHYIDAHILS